MRLNSKKKNILSFKLIFLLVLFYFLVSFSLNYFNFDLWKNNLKSYFESKIKLAEENVNLKKEIKKLEVRNEFSNYIFKKYLDLNKKLFFQDGGKKRSFYKIYFNDGFLYNSFVIKNKNYNFFKGQKVYFFDNFLFGKIVAIDNKFVKLRAFSDFGFKNNFIILENNEIIYRGEGVGDSNGLIKIELPRKLELKKDTVLILDDGEMDIVGKFFKDNFLEQKTSREVYFKMVKNPKTTLEVEI